MTEALETLAERDWLGVEMDRPMRFICPRECPSPHTDHCVGENAVHIRCDFCGKFMPMSECIYFEEACDD